MFDLDRWREIFQAMSKNKLRTILTGFTVAFAILLFTLLFGIGNGLQNNFKSQFADDAVNAIFIRSGKTSKAYKGNQIDRKIQFKNDDFKFLIDKYDKKIEYITARVYKQVRAIYKGEQSTYTVRAVHPDHQFTEKTVVDKGRFLNNFDLQKKVKVVVIGRLVEKDLFGNHTALNKQLNLNDINYTVIGVFSDVGGDREERLIYMPVTTAQAIYGNNDYLDQIVMTYNPKMNVDQALNFSNDIKKELKKKHIISPKDQAAIRVHNVAKDKKDVNKFMSVLNVIILFIGFGTLIAGIIGISNIMIFVVKERTKELGIRKALGAKPKAIIGMILQESVLITTIAGYVGLMLGIGILKWYGPVLKDYFIKDPSVSKSVVIGATIVLIIAGTLAGYVPAKRAARIKPIEALNAD
ncbi:MAG: ABC transporter permease [Flavobacteriaceae bacterium]|nr:ABC transporter permease [Flavobacteriaceae bacterium]